MIALGGMKKLHLDPSKPPVFDGISLRIAQGETCGLCGPGASGKSLLLKIICGLIRPEAGTVAVAGQDLGAASPSELRSIQSQIGYLFQNNALFDSMTVQENVAFPLRQRVRLGQEALDEPQILDRVSESLRGVGLATHAAKMPSQLSGGQRKRVALARAVVTRPPLLIYDEPTAGLDPVTTAKIYDLLRAEQKLTKSTTLIVSSDIDALRRFADRMLMVYRGTLCYDGPSADMDDSASPVVRQFVRGELEGPL
ncbi:MAG: ATP-binding cassette domain-containing protein [Polyangia bacterium]